MTRASSRRRQVGQWAIQAVAAIGIFVAAPASAYVRTRFDSNIPVAWTNQCIPMVVHNANPPAPLTPDAVLKATAAAASAWGRPGFTCTMLNLTTTPTTETNAPVGNDGVNRVAFREDRWCRHPDDPKIPCYDPLMLALTTLTALPDGTILDADIEVNAVDYKWADRSVAGTKGQDLQSALVHEFGHLIGLDHTCGVKNPLAVDNAGKAVPGCGFATTEQRASIMFPTATSANPLRRVLAADDAKAVCQIYAIKNTAPACRIDAGVPDSGVDAGTAKADTADGGGCAMGGRSPGRAAGSSPMAFAALVALTLIRLVGRRSRRT